MEKLTKLIVGIFVAGCLLLFGVGLFLIGNSSQMFSKSFRVYADFSKITGIHNGGRVRVGGMDAGTVTRIDVPTRPDGKFRLHLRIVERLHPMVRQDSVVTIQTDGLLGNKYLEVAAGSSGIQLAQNESLIDSKEPFDWGDLLDEVNGVVSQVRGIVGGVERQIGPISAQIEQTVRTANLLIKDSTPHVKGILTSTRTITTNLQEIIDGVREGQGTVGALFKDEELYASVKRSVESGETAAGNLRDTSISAKRIFHRVDDSEIVPEVQKTVKNIQQITLQVKDAVDKFQAASGEGGVGENLQRTLADAHEAMSDLSDNTEALKHNFLFRGYFKKRGFYDLGMLTAQEYRKPAFGKGFKRHRIWLESANLFTKDAAGVEVLSVEGKARLDEAMTEILNFPRNGPLILEGFAGTGTTAQQYLTGRRRAVRVQVYLIGRFNLRPAYLGVVSIGAEPVGEASPGAWKEGVGLVSFYK
jgi:phospholipid/cholesterol/gamma-HCH transport system substrate-binding protein